MKLLYISKSKYYDQTITNNLKELCEQDSIAFFYSYADAQDFIDNNVIKNKISIDLIITENNQKISKYFHESLDMVG